MAAAKQAVVHKYEYGFWSADHNLVVHDKVMAMQPLLTLVDINP